MSSPRFVSPAVGTVTSEWGPRTHPVTGAAGFHRGMDIAAAQGTPIRSAFTGTVRAVRTDSYRGDTRSNPVTGTWNTGNFVVVDRPDGNTEWYGHLHTVSVNAGQTVTAGDRIGTMGATGNVTGVHLHFESWNGRDQGGGSGAGNTINPRTIYNRYGITPGQDGSAGADPDERTWFDMATEADLRRVVREVAHGERDWLLSLQTNQPRVDDMGSEITHANVLRRLLIITRRIDDAVKSLVAS